MKSLLRLFRKPQMTASPEDLIASGAHALEKEDHKTAIANFRKAAEQNDPVGQYLLASLINRGQGTPQDFIEASKWYKKAAEQGHGAAQLSLGLAFKDGQGVHQSFTRAAKWFRKAAEQGDPLAQFYLGHMYLQGQGLVQDYVQGYMWLQVAYSPENSRWIEMAETDGYAMTQDKWDLIKDNMTPSQIAEAERLTNDWKSNHQ